MLATTPIRILAADSNKVGDLFARLVEGVFLALGYDGFRRNVHKSGREIDIEGTHRKEPRRLLAECKATEESTGGSDINKFVGSIDAEKRKHPDNDTVAYFVSLGGFKETAIEQEKEIDNSRVVLMNGQQVLEELTKGKIICPTEMALHLAGKALGDSNPTIKADPACELLAHDLGFIWAVYFTTHHQRTHLSLVHADGELLARELADEVIATDKSSGGALHRLVFLLPPAPALAEKEGVALARAHYLEYLSKECGEIELAGLPADQDAGSKRLRLENIFVPLHLVRASQSKPEQSQQAEGPTSAAHPDALEFEAASVVDRRRPVGEVIAEHPRLAILGLPGGGKSTLLKRLATAYAFPKRRSKVDDQLPDRDWLPLFIRCRQIVHQLQPSILDVLRALQKRAEMPDHLIAPFGSLVTDSLRSGNALLLIDGLDEIADPGNRLTFISQLRVFLTTYPAIAVVLTSREAGFRVVGGSLSSLCEHYRLADFDNTDIKQLTLAWHKEVVGDKAEVRREAEKLAQTICSMDRVRGLAQNPLLLTTLLLVQRWVGQLPPKRSVLYAKAIEVLLMTWNVEAHVPLDQEEVVPQLAFVAFVMMKEGIQNISAKKLKDALYKARKQMPEILGYARLSVNELVEQVEMRSSILVLSGHVLEDGTLYPMYEFRHLTFQEYLAARALVDGFYPDRVDGDSPLSVLQPYIKRQDWKEIVPLAAVLAGREARGLISYLIEQVKVEDAENIRSNTPPERKQVASVELLVLCMADEVQIAPGLLETAMEGVARCWRVSEPLITELARSRYGEVFFDVCKKLYFSSNEQLMPIGGALGGNLLVRLGWAASPKFDDSVNGGIDALLDSGDPRQEAMACLAIMEIAWHWCSRLGYTSDPSGKRSGKKLPAPIRRRLLKWTKRIAPLCDSAEITLQLAAVWAAIWLRTIGTWSSDADSSVVKKFAGIWANTPYPELQYLAAWTIYRSPLKDRGAFKLSAEAWLIELVQSTMSADERPLWRSAKRRAAITLAYYIGAPWTDQELAGKLRELEPFPSRAGMLKALEQAPISATLPS